MNEVHYKGELMALKPVKKLNQAKIKARLKMLKKLCSQARKGYIKLSLNDVYMAEISWCISISEGQREPYCLIHYGSKVDSPKINTAESQERMITRITEGDDIGGSSFATLLDACIENTITIVKEATPKEQPG